MNFLYGLGALVLLGIGAYVAYFALCWTFYGIGLAWLKATKLPPEPGKSYRQASIEWGFLLVLSSVLVFVVVSLIGEAAVSAWNRLNK